MGKMEIKKELSFTPLSEGLGFHPFSDGLPYAPVVKKSRERPVGAMLAGTPSVSPAITQPGPIGRPLPAPPIARVNVPTASPQASSPLLAQVQRELTTRASEPEAAPLVEARFGFGYLLKRIFAYGIDSALNLAAVMAALSFALIRNHVKPEALLNDGVILLTVIFLIFFNWAVITAQEIAFGTSLGKRLFGLSLQGSASATFLRAFFFLPSVGFAGVGLLWALFNRKRRCWHDTIMDLQPAELARL
jgi:hypothetical protein